jgi:hypothetical protein
LLFGFEGSGDGMLGLALGDGGGWRGDFEGGEGTPVDWEEG